MLSSHTISIATHDYPHFTHTITLLVVISLAVTTMGSISIMVRARIRMVLTQPCTIYAKQGSRSPPNCLAHHILWPIT